MTPKEAFECLCNLTTLDEEDFKMWVGLRYDVEQALTELEELKQEVIDRQETEKSLTREFIKLGDNYEQLQRDVNELLSIIDKTYVSVNVEYENEFKSAIDKLKKAGKSNE